jgi:hypothetical protein
MMYDNYGHQVNSEESDGPIFDNSKAKVSGVTQFLPYNDTYFFKIHSNIVFLSMPRPS